MGKAHLRYRYTLSSCGQQLHIYYHMKHDLNVDWLAYYVLVPSQWVRRTLKLQLRQNNVSRVWPAYYMHAHVRTAIAIVTVHAAEQEMEQQTICFTAHVSNISVNIWHWEHLIQHAHLVLHYGIHVRTWRIWAWRLDLNHAAAAAH